MAPKKNHSSNALITLKKGIKDIPNENISIKRSTANKISSNSGKWHVELQSKSIKKKKIKKSTNNNITKLQATDSELNKFMIKPTKVDSVKDVSKKEKCGGVSKNKCAVENEKLSKKTCKSDNHLISFSNNKTEAATIIQENDKNKVKLITNDNAGLKVDEIFSVDKNSFPLELKEINENDLSDEDNERRLTYPLDKTVNDVTVLQLNETNMNNDVTIQKQNDFIENLSAIKVPAKTLLDSNNTEHDLKNKSIIKIEKLNSTPKQTSTPKLILGSSLSKCRKMPNFALIHQKAMDKMENITDYHERKAERAKLLLSSHKSPLKKITDNKVMHKLSKESIVVNKKPIIHNKVLQVINKKITVNNKPLTASKQLSQKNGIIKRDALDKENQIKTVSKKCNGSTNNINNRRCVIKGVRTNKRFELLMKMRYNAD